MSAFKDRPASSLRRVLAAAGDHDRAILPYIPRRHIAATVARRADLTLPAGFIAPCLPMTAPSPPSGRMWLHEMKHDGLRIIARKDDRTVRLYGSSGEDLSLRFPLIRAALARLPSCTIDGEAMVCDDDGNASFALLERALRDQRVFLYAFDLLEVDGKDRRRDLLMERKLDLARLLADAPPGIVANQWVDGTDYDGAAVFAHACARGLEGIVSKRKDSRYISGRSPYWLVTDNPAVAAERWQAFEDPDRQ
jgi:bifunctional non-homologous end joining protein LigD